MGADDFSLKWNRMASIFDAVVADRSEQGVGKISQSKIPGGGGGKTAMLLRVFF